jgi:hypothetical protein
MQATGSVLRMPRCARLSASRGLCTLLPDWTAEETLQHWSMQPHHVVGSSDVLERVTLLA